MALRLNEIWKQQTLIEDLECDSDFIEWSSALASSPLSFLFGEVDSIIEAQSVREKKLFNATYGYNLADCIGVNTATFVDTYFSLYANREIIAGINSEKTEENYLKMMRQLKKQVNFAILNNAQKYVAMLESYCIEYNPVNNYDMHDYGIHSRTVDKSTNVVESEGSTTTKNNNTSSNENKTSQFNNADYSPNEKDEGTEQNLNVARKGWNGIDNVNDPLKDTQTTTESNTLSKSFATSDGETIADGNAHEIDVEKSRRYGNLGVTTQQMLESEVKVKSLRVLQSIFDDINNQILLKLWR